ncbi:MAG: hypothetical protein JWO36_4138 [Myxococcales bacterium]|nr:hypothetical protein [Myxococcales bacterium]
MSDPIKAFVAQSPPIDSVREEAARCCDETARVLRGERGRLRTPEDRLLAEFCDAAFGVAAEVAMVVCDALKTARLAFRPDFPWDTAAALLRNGWQRGHKLLPHIVGTGAKA